MKTMCSMSLVHIVNLALCANDLRTCVTVPVIYFGSFRRPSIVNSLKLICETHKFRTVKQEETEQNTHSRYRPRFWPRSNRNALYCSANKPNSLLGKVHVHVSLKFRGESRGGPTGSGPPPHPLTKFGIFL